jgi:hypothetical protein
VHEDNRFGGFGAEIAATIAQEGFHYLDAPPTRLGGPDVPGVPFSTPLENGESLEAVAGRLRDELLAGGAIAVRDRRLVSTGLEPPRSA